MIKNFFNSKQVLLGIILCLSLLVALLAYRLNTPQMNNIVDIPKQDTVSTVATQKAANFKSDIDIGRRTVTVYDCGMLDDFEVMHKGVAVFKANAQELFGASQLRQLNQKNTFRLDRINGDCKIKLGPIFNSPIAAN